MTLDELYSLCDALDTKMTDELIRQDFLKRIREWARIRRDCSISDIEKAVKVWVLKTGREMFLGGFGEKPFEEEKQLWEFMSSHSNVEEL